MATIDRVLSCPTLPSLPAVAVEVLALTRSPDVSLADISRVVQNDPGLAAKILKTVNSSFYGLQQPCSRLDRAMSYLGLQAVKSLVLGFSLVDATRGVGNKPGVDLRQHWRRTIFAAAGARQIAQLTRAADPDEAFTAALFQDIGILACVAALSDEYVSTLATAPEDHDLLCRHEREVFPFDHTTIGAELARKWKLPDLFTEVIRKHHAPDAGGLTYGPVVRIAALSMYLSEVMSTPSASSLLTRLATKAEAWFSIPSDRVAAILKSTASSANELAKLFEQDVAIPNASLIIAEAQDALLTGQIQMQRETDRLRVETQTDTLTGVGNRRRFDEAFADAFAQAKKNHGSVCVLMIDADKFKSVNDRFGHPAGDAVLKQIASRVAATTADRGLVCRFGGEEFAVILRSTDGVRAREIAEEIRTSIASKPLDLASVEGAPPSLAVTISLGIGYMDDASGEAATQEKLLALADQALYAAKSAGRNCVRSATLMPDQPPARRASDSKSGGVARSLRHEDGVLRVLVVEDDPLAAKLLSMLLQRLPNTEARVATSIAAVHAVLAGNDFRPGVAILDQHLPDGRGVDLIQEIRSQTPDIRKIVVMSASISPEIESTARQAGADSLVSKIEMCSDIGRWVLSLLGQEAKAA